MDSDPKKLKALKAGRIPIHEPGLGEVFRRVARSGRLSFAASVVEGLRFKGRRAEVVFIAVGTPP
ncbi:MAG TPA: UDP-glucose 6-dehydrogenase, partial [Elusimicrobia bacterium]|nr:UDP-glucose 6-dehydrogenase [Elusimicrobiota bacterium]